MRQFFILLKQFFHQKPKRTFLFDIFMETGKKFLQKRFAAQKKETESFQLTFSFLFLDSEFTTHKQKLQLLTADSSANHYN